MATPAPPRAASPDRGLSAELRAALAARCAPDGFLPFDRYMEVVLYHPAVGYYARTRSPFGPSGDFYTAGRVHPLYARALARRIGEIERRLGGPRPFGVVDLGTGDGGLLTAVASELRREGELDGWEFVAVDRAPERAASAEQALRTAVRGTNAEVRAGASLAELGPVQGVVLAHELLDAQPARRLVWTGERWREWGARFRGERLEPADAPARPVSGPALPTLDASDAGAVLEIAPTAEGLLREVGDHLVFGVAIVIDFGAEESELLAGHAGGTLAAVRSHRSLADPWDAPGEADLSTFVNFTRARAAARSAGLRELAYRGQAEALTAWGLPDLLASAEQAAGSDAERVKVRLAAKNLLFGFGTFRVLELGGGPAAARPGEGTTGPSSPAPP